ncbi:MAG: hypothetical protein HND55_08590 [Pseudomonadota bacterium]|nr:MAG: hypothetical protein HND55_08590 [Pseudomonadota bacterium]
MITARQAAACAAMLLTVAGCSDPAPDEEQILARIEAMQSALAEGRPRAFMAPVSEDFSGATLNLDRRAARLLLRREMLSHEQLRARLIDIDINVKDQNRATASFQAIVTGGSGLIPSTGRWYRVETGWRLEDGDWMLLSARWTPVAGSR